MVEVLFFVYLVYGLYYAGKNFELPSLGVDTDSADRLLVLVFAWAFFVLFWPVFMGLAMRAKRDSKESDDQP